MLLSSVLAYSLAGDQETLRWIVGIQKSCANQSAFELSRHMSRLTRLGTHTAIEGLDGRIAPEVTKTLEQESQNVESGNVSVASSELRESASSSS